MSPPLSAPCRLVAFILFLLACISIMNAQPAPATSRFDVTQMNFRGAETSPDGIGFHFDLGTLRQNWTHARWSVHELEERLDLSAAAGLVLEVHTDTPRRDAGVYLAIREADGSWYSHPWACGLSAASGLNRGNARFEHFNLPLYHSPPNGSFQDANEKLDLDSITAIAIGVVNPLGIGTVSFTLRALELLPAVEADDAPAVLEVTGRLLDINGTDTLPSGLFGGFHLGTGRHERFRLAANRTIHHDGVGGQARLGSEHTPIYINTIGDRVRPSPRLTRSDWEERSAALGRSMARTALDAGKALYVEYWNEPYLNWANFNRANFIPRFYDVSRAEEGGPVHILHDGKEVPHLIWTRDRRHFRPFMVSGGVDRRLDHWRRGRLPDGRVLSTSAQPYRSMEPYYGSAWEPASHPPLDVPDGDTYEYKGQTLTAFTPWHVIDTSQFTYWAGKGMLPHYIDPMLAFGRALKEENPEAVFIVGWGNRPGEDHWAGFHQLYQATIDAGIDIIDGYNDHDYGGHPANMGAQYEVVTAYGVTRHNKWLYAYNTEAGANTDPQVYRNQATVSANVSKFGWVSHKMMHTMALLPDKARVFLHFGDGNSTGSSGGGWWSDLGEGLAMQMLINLRGRLLHTRGGDEDLYVVATLDGTDPSAPRPDFLTPGKEMVVAVFNARPSSRAVELRLRAPAGAQPGPGRMLHSIANDGQIGIIETPVTLGDGFQESILLGPRELRVYSFPLENAEDLNEDPAAWPGALPPVERRQFFGKTLIQDVHPDAPVEEVLTIPADVLANATGAELGFVARRLPGNTAELELNGTRIPLPAVMPPENNDGLHRLSLPLDLLREENQIRIVVPSPDSPGFFLGMWSLWIETDASNSLEGGGNAL